MEFKRHGKRVGGFFEDQEEPFLKKGRAGFLYVFLAKRQPAHTPHYLISITPRVIYDGLMLWTLFYFKTSLIGIN